MMARCAQASHQDESKAGSLDPDGQRALWTACDADESLTCRRRIVIPKRRARDAAGLRGLKHLRVVGAPFMGTLCSFADRATVS